MKTTKRQQNIASLLAKPGAKLADHNYYQFITYEPLSIAVFGKTGARPRYHYRFRSNSEMTDFMQRRINEANLEAEREKIRIHRDLEESQKFKPGTILYSSWGYEQTNIDFYQIIERKGQFVTLQEIGSEKTYEEWGDRGRCKPDPKVLIGDPFRKKISQNASIRLTSYSFAQLYEGRPLYWSSYA